MEAATIRKTLEAAAKRGRLAGYSQSAASETLFVVRDFGHPFESNLTARSEQMSGEITRLTFERQLRPLLPWVFATMLVLSVEPGWRLTHSLIITYFPSYSIRTWIWYLPLTVPFVPWAFWSAIKRSRASGNADARKIIEEISEHLGEKKRAAAEQRA